MTVEEKLLEKIRKVLIADATLEPYLNKRVYASHISSIAEPKYPAISLFLLTSKPDLRVPVAVQVRIQLDAWFPASEYNASDMFGVLDRIRSLLHKQDLTDTAIGVTVYQSIQTETGPMLFEDDTELYHLPAIFEMVAI